MEPLFASIFTQTRGGVYVLFKKKCRYISFLRVPICHTLRVPQSCLRARSTLPPPTAAAAARFISDALLNKSMKVSSCAGCFFFIQRGLTGLHLKVLRHIYERKCNTFVVPCRPFFFFFKYAFLKQKIEIEERVR